MTCQLRGHHHSRLVLKLIEIVYSGVGFSPWFLAVISVPQLLDIDLNRVIISPHEMKIVSIGKSAEDQRKGLPALLLACLWLFCCLAKNKVHFISGGVEWKQKIFRHYG